MRLWETLHGHLGVLAAAALLHPALLLRRGKPLTTRNRYAVFGASALVVAAFATGLFIYPGYRVQVRSELFLRSVRAGFLFETKEHLAYAVIALTLGASACALLAPRDPSANDLRRAAALVYAAGAALCVATVALGSYVASVHGF